MTQFHTTPMRNTVEHVIRDLEGRPVLTVRKTDYTVIEPDGSISTHEQSEPIELVDGTIWSPDMLNGQKPVLVGICVICRQPPPGLFRPRRPVHGICTLRDAKRCADCGLLACPRHRRLIDGHWRCPLCATKYRRAAFIKSIFFSREDG